MYWGDSFIGTGLTKDIRAMEAGREVRICRSTQKISLLRANTLVGIEIEGEEAFQSADGRGIRFMIRMDLGLAETLIEGVYGENEIQIRETVGKNVKNRTTPIPPNMKNSLDIEKWMLNPGIKPGAETTMTVFLMDALGIVDATIRYLDDEIITAMDETHRCRKFLTVFKSMPGMEVLTWLDPMGTVIKMETPTALGRITQILCDPEKEQASSPDRAQTPKEMFTSVFVYPSGESLTDKTDAKEVRLILRLKEGNLQDYIDLSLFSDAEIVPEGVRVLLKRPSIPKAGQKTEPRERRESATRSDDAGVGPDFADADDPAIREKLKEIIPKEMTNKAEIAEKLVRWVYNYIEDKSLDVGFASASEVLEHKKGDCSEHTVLFAAMARAAGIRCRVLTGLGYSSESDFFAYHIWPEVFIGRWVPVDPAFNQFPADTLHIPFARCDKITVFGLAKESSALMKIVGNVEIAVPPASPPDSK